MTATGTGSGDRNRMHPWRLVSWGVAASLLLLPLVANAPWTLSDYFAMAVLLGAVGLVLELAVRTSSSVCYRLGVGLAVITAFLLVWVNLAVGFLGTEDNPANLLFLAVLAVALLGSMVGGFKPAAMTKAFMAAFAVQLLIGALALVARLGSPGGHGVYEAVLGTGVFATLWLASALLFHRAAQEPREGSIR